MRRIIQGETAECGLVALAMIADHYGQSISLTEMRSRFSVSLRGARLNQLITVAQQLGFSSRALRVEVDELDLLKLPCILHWNLNHFVVLVSVGSAGASIMDPALGERRVNRAELSRCFTGVALELTPNALFEERPPKPTVSLRQLTGRVEGLWRSLAHVFTLSLALQAFVVVSPFFVQWTVDQVLVSADRNLLVILGLAFGTATLIQGSITLLRGLSVIHLSAQLGIQWASNIFAHLLRLPLEFFERRHLGDITSRMSSIQTIQRIVTTSFVEGLIDGVMAITTLGMMALYSVSLALVTLVAVGLYLAVRWLFFRAMRDRTELQLVAAAKQQTHLLETIRGVRSLKVAGHLHLRRAGYENLMVESTNHSVKLSRLELAFVVASQSIFGIEKVAVIWIGATLALQNVFSVGMLIAYLAYKELFTGRVSALIDKWIELRMLRLHGERLGDIALAAPEDVTKSTQVIRASSPRLVVSNVSFRYSALDPWVIRNCSFTVEPGETVAIVGASGCGKSTLIKLVLGLLSPVEGAVSLGGVDVSRADPQSFQSVVAAVLQDDQLFAGSVADNICMFDGEMDLNRIEAAARLASVHEEIIAMPMGYHSLIGDMGSTLSGGQKQRVILARALYRDPKLLVLDEATSHLDVKNEHQVSQAVKKLRLSKLLVAHREETIASADRVLLLSNGKLRMAAGADVLSRVGASTRASTTA